MAQHRGVGRAEHGQAARALEPRRRGGALGARSWRSRPPRRSFWPSRSCRRGAASSSRAPYLSRSRSSSPRTSISCALRSGADEPSGRTPGRGGLAQPCCRAGSPARGGRHRARRDLSPTSRWCRRILDIRCSGSRSSRLAVRRPGMLPFAVELTPVAEALVVAGVIPDPLAEPTREEEAPAPLESAVLYVTREDWTRVQDEFQALAGQFASLKVQILTDGPLPWLARSLQGTEAVNLLQGEFARSTDYNARWLRWRTAAMLAGGLLFAHVAAAMIRIHQANHETQLARHPDLANLPAGHAVRENAGPAPPDAVTSRSDPPFGRRAGVLSACSRSALERGLVDAEHTHRFAQLSRAGARPEGHGSQPHRACRNSLSK